MDHYLFISGGEGSLYSHGHEYMTKDIDQW
jgi:hypothetical protein